MRMTLYIFLLMERNKKKRPWTEQVRFVCPQEIALLETLYPTNGSKKWKKMAQGMSKKGFHRSEIEIRERWINFLDPSLNKTRWEEPELQKLYDIYDQVGTKWCIIQKFIGRTQNMIKNRFYGTLRNFVRYLVTRTDHRNESFNQLISKLSPKILNDIYRAQNQFKFMGDEVKSAIYCMHFKIDKKILAERVQEKRPIYQRLKSIVHKIFDQMRKMNDSESESQSEEEEEEEFEPKGKKIACVKKEEIVEKVEERLSEENYQEEDHRNVYPFMEKEANNILFRVENTPYYPFMNYPTNYNCFETYSPYSNQPLL